MRAPAARRLGRAVLVAAARWRDRVGMAGLLGLALLSAAALLYAAAWREHRAEVALGATRPWTPMDGPPPPSVATPLPPASDIPLLLTRVQRAALEQGLGWPRADYRINPAADDAPASLEVRCALKAPYLSVRRFVTALLQDMPTLTLREFSLSRPNPQAADVEAKLAIVVYLAAGAPSTEASR